jgi:riboflavin synthase
MFTGLVKEVSRVIDIKNIASGKQLYIESKSLINDIEIDDSVSVNGACQTVVKKNENGFFVESVATTLKKSTLGDLRSGDIVNLELAMRLGDRLGGHLVQGHVNGMARVLSIQTIGDNYLLNFSVPRELLKYVVLEGSITLDGVSLTISELNKESGWAQVSVIPHTWNNTKFKMLKIGDKVNLEVDILAKYVESLFHKGGKSSQSVEKTTESIITEEWLKSRGY